MDASVRMFFIIVVGDGCALVGRDWTIRIQQDSARHFSVTPGQNTYPHDRKREFSFTGVYAKFLNMSRRSVLSWFIAFHLANSAAEEPRHHGPSVNFDLRRSCAGWQAGFADYYADQESFYELAWACANGPTNLNRGLFISGSNHSDDLFMFIKHRIHGLKPSTTYRIEARVQFWSKAPTGCVGIGGDSGENVYVKFGAASEEPLTVLEDGVVRMNVDIGNQAHGGANAEVIGNIATSITDCHNERYELKELETRTPLLVRADRKGTLWIFVGTDSGFEGKTSLIYTQVRLHLHKGKD